MDRYGSVLLVAWGLLCGPQAGTQTRKPMATGWQATGTLLEVCSCSVPCPCNFGQGPSNDFCHTVYAYRLKTARYEALRWTDWCLGREADKGAMGYLDSRATPAQRVALEKLALAIFGKGGASSGKRTFTWTKIVAESDPQHFKIEFGDTASIAANVLMGRDGKNPIVVENNTTWPVHRFIKAKTTRFDYTDTLGNRLRYDGVNANLGDFKLSSDQTSVTGKTCCK